MLEVIPIPLRLKWNKAVVISESSNLVAKYEEGFLNSNKLSLLRCLLRFASIALVTTAFLAGCSGGYESAADSQPRTADASSMIDVNSEAELRTFLKPGTSADEVAARCGDPFLTRSFPGGEMWLYSIARFPKPDQPGTYVDGFSVTFTNGQLMRWGYSYVAVAGETIKTETLVQAATKGDDASRLEFFVVHEGPIGGGRFIDTASLPKLGFVTANPDLVIGRLEQVTLEERLLVGSGNQKQTNWCFKFTLPAGFIPALTAMTATNVSKRILMTANEEPVFAPTVQSPIKTANFEVTVSDRSSMEQLKQNLTRIPQPAP